MNANAPVIEEASQDDLAIMKQICFLLSDRCALLVSIPMAVFIERMPLYDPVTIAITGSLYKYHARLKGLLEQHIAKLLTDRRSFNIFLSDDGSGKGAGLVAAIAARRSLT